MPQTAHEPYPWLGLARQALDAVGRGPSATGPSAGQIVTRIAEEHGADVIPRVMIAWIDTMLCEIGAVRVGDDGSIPWRDQPLRLTYVVAESGDTTTDADDLTPAGRWAVRLINCRSVGDQATYEALLDAISDDRTWSEGVSALLGMCGLTIAHARRGMARRG